MSIEKTIETVRSHEGEISISEICDLADAYEAKEAENVRLAKEVAAINKGAKTNARVVELLNKKVIQLQSENAELRKALKSVYETRPGPGFLYQSSDHHLCVKIAKAVLDKYK